MDFNGVQTIQGPKKSFNAASKGFKWHQTMNKGLQDWRKKDMDILDDMRVSKLSAKVFFKVNYSFKTGVMMLKIWSA